MECLLKVSTWGDPGIGDQIIYTPDATNVRKQTPKKPGFSPIVNNLKNGVPRRLKTGIPKLPDALPLTVAATYLCTMRKLRMDELPRKTRTEFQQAEKLPVLLLLENIRSMHNVGSIFRTADAFLARGIFLCGYTPRPPHRDIHKTALGATETVEWKYSESALEAVKNLKVGWLSDRGCGTGNRKYTFATVQTVSR